MTTPLPTGRRVPIIDLGKEYAELRSELDPAISEVLLSGSYILGKKTEQLERQIASYCGARHAIGVNSGTDAITIALRALDIGPGDEVLVPSMSFIATAEPVALLGARPVFVDIDLTTYAIDPASVAAKITAKTKALIVVHLYGQPADLRPLLDITQKHKLALIEDMAQAIGSEYEGKKVGSFGTIACVSFFPTKNLGAYGDGGAVLTPDDRLAQRIRRLRNHGAAVKYHHEEVGYNSRLDELQAAILSIKLNYLDRWNDKRRQLAADYSRRLAGLPITLPQEAASRKHIYHLYSIRAAKRDALRQFLEQRQIATGLHYPMPLHLQPAFSGLGGRKGEFPNGERLAAETLSLPLYPQMEKGDVEYVAEAVRRFFTSSS